MAEALQQGPEVRQLAVSVLKNLLIKHAMDDRYTAFKVREGGALKDDWKTGRQAGIGERVEEGTSVQSNYIWKMMHSKNTRKHIPNYITTKSNSPSDNVRY